MIAALLLVIMIIPSLGHSQSISKRPDIKEGVSQLQKKWQPIYAFKDYNNIMQSSPTDVGTPNLTNIKNGVSFYKKTCSSVAKKTIIVKLVNSNNYSAKISWQLSADLPVTFVVIPPNSEMEGLCPVTNGGGAKLVIQIPEGANSEQFKNYLYTHTFVTKL